MLAGNKTDLAERRLELRYKIFPGFSHCILYSGKFPLQMVRRKLKT